MKSINPKRKKFCRLIAGGESGAGAYRKAYKSSNNNTCKRNAHRLMQQPGVLIYLAVLHGAKEQAGPPAADKTAAPKGAGRQKPQSAVPSTVKRTKQRKAQRVYEVMDEPERRVILSRIARGQIMLTRYLVVKGTLVEKPVPPNFNQRFCCIAELNKMRGKNV